MTDRSVYYVCTEAGWIKRIIPHISRPWPEGRRSVDTASRSGIYDDGGLVYTGEGELGAIGLHTVSRTCMYHDGIRQREQCLVDMAEEARRLELE